MDTTQKPVRSRTSEMVIGKTKYIVTSHYKENGRETAEQKLVDYVSDNISNRLKTLKNGGLSAV